MKFKSLKFELKEDLVVYLYDLFYFTIPLSEVRRIDRGFKVKGNEILIKSDKRFMFLIDKYIPGLKFKLNGNKAVYLHENSGIPLFGLKFIGIIDKGTDMIEVKPLTGCSMNCKFCSVGEGIDSRKEVDFVVEEEYLVNEVRKLLEYKKEGKYSIWINPHGEPLLYSRIFDLCKDLSALKQVKEVHVITSGALLNEKLIDEFAKLKKVKLNVSISGFGENAKKLMGFKGYDVKKVLKIIEYAVGKVDTVITPVYLKGKNDEDIEKIIEFGLKNKIKIRIQKFCRNKFGRNPIEEQGWEDFNIQMKLWEKKFNVDLIEKGKIGKSKELPRVFKRDDSVMLDIKCPGRFLKDRVGVAKGRCVLLPSAKRLKGTVKFKISDNKYGMYIAS